jgi:hypothetical protein
MEIAVIGARDTIREKENLGDGNQNNNAYYFC